MSAMIDLQYVRTGYTSKIQYCVNEVFTSAICTFAQFRNN